MKYILKPNNVIPFNGYNAVAFYPFVFVRKDSLMKMKESRFVRLMTHEAIHLHQQIELLLVGFYLLYGLFYLLGLLRWRNHSIAYRRNPFEREAYENDKFVFYPRDRKAFSWINYIKL